MPLSRVMPDTDDYTAKVPALLAKAESTEYPEEAEAFFAKAQELMTRHSIDEAMLSAAGTTERQTATSAKIVCRAPYATAKATLLNEIAKANSCKAVRIGKANGNQILHLFGFADDLKGTEDLFVALSVHATREVLSAEVPWYDSPRAFRHSFLLGFAGRIGERLRAAREVARTEYEAETGTSTALVLRDRAAEVQTAFETEYPRTTSTRTSSTGSGGGAGRAAADRASLGQRSVGAQRPALAR